MFETGSFRKSSLLLRAETSLFHIYLVVTQLQNSTYLRFPEAIYLLDPFPNAMISCQTKPENKTFWPALIRLLLLPVYLALLYNHFVGFLPHDATMKPDLCPVDHWNTDIFVLVSLVMWTLFFFTLTDKKPYKDFMCHFQYPFYQVHIMIQGTQNSVIVYNWLS